MLLIYAASDIVVAEHNVSTSIVIRNQIPMMMYIFDPEQNVAIDYYLTVFSECLHLKTNQRCKLKHNFQVVLW